MTEQKKEKKAPYLSLTFHKNEAVAYATLPYRLISKAFGYLLPALSIYEMTNAEPGLSDAEFTKVSKEADAEIKQRNYLTSQDILSKVAAPRSLKYSISSILFDQWQDKEGYVLFIEKPQKYIDKLRYFIDFENDVLKNTEFNSLLDYLQLYSDSMSELATA